MPPNLKSIPFAATMTYTATDSDIKADQFGSSGLSDSLPVSVLSDASASWHSCRLFVASPRSLTIDAELDLYSFMASRAFAPNYVQQPVAQFEN